MKRLTRWLRNRAAGIVEATCEITCRDGQMCLMYEMPSCRRWRLLAWLLGIDIDGGDDIADLPRGSLFKRPRA